MSLSPSYLTPSHPVHWCSSILIWCILISAFWSCSMKLIWMTNQLIRMNSIGLKVKILFLPQPKPCEQTGKKMKWFSFLVDFQLVWVSSPKLITSTSICFYFFLLNKRNELKEVKMAWNWRVLSIFGGLIISKSLLFANQKQLFCLCESIWCQTFCSQFEYNIFALTLN